MATPKFLICGSIAFALCQDKLLKTISRFHFILNADMDSYFALVLTPRLRLVEVA